MVVVTKDNTIPCRHDSITKFTGVKTTQTIVRLKKVQRSNLRKKISVLKVVFIVSKADGPTLTNKT